MKRITVVALAAAAMLAVALPARAQDKAAAAAPDYSKCLEVQGTSDYNFGKIDQDASVEHTFVLKNTCGSTIELDNPRASCGCTAAMLSEKVIKPGEEAKIQVKFKPPMGTRGKTSKTVSVFVKGDANPVHILRFNADVKTDIEINPSYINILGAEVGKLSTGTASFKNVTDQPVEITDMTLSLTAYADTNTVAGAQPSSVMKPVTTGKLEPSTFTLKPGESKDVTVSVTPEWKGQINGSIRYKSGKGEGFLQVFSIVRPAAAANGAGTSK